MSVSSNGRPMPASKATTNRRFQWIAPRWVTIRIKKPRESPRTIPAPLDCSKRYVSDANVPIASAQAVRALDQQYRSSYQNGTAEQFEEESDPVIRARS